MKTLLSLAALLWCNLCIAQTVPSSCTASDSIVKKYMIDADYMALKRMQQNNYVDSIVIPQSWTDTSLRALIAVYNAIALPARDSVVNIYNIHNLNTDMLTHLSLVADSMAGYMVQMKSNTFPTGFIPFDDLMTKYNMDLKIYASIVFQGPPNAHGLFLESDSTYNMDALADSFAALPNAFSAGAAFFNIYADSLEITDTLNPGYIALDYRYSWDCGGLNGCLYSRVWHFRVKYGCDSVTFTGSDGDPLPTTSIRPLAQNGFSIYPNPVTDRLTLSTPNNAVCDYTIVGINGQAMQAGKSAKDIDVARLPKGLYIIRLQHNGQTTALKFFKE